GANFFQNPPCCCIAARTRHRLPSRAGRTKIKRMGSGRLSFWRSTMPHSGDSQVTAVLQAAQAGDRQAAKDLLPLVYAELQELARSRLARQPPGQTLTSTALVHEAYLRVAGDSNVTWEGRQHFFFAAARAMRDIL